jgi:UbiD family decarboxylase
VPPAFVDRGPVLENIREGDAVDLTQFPVPIWHELDGAPYIGTGHTVIQQDPETGVVNVGTYRGQLHDPRTTGIFFTLPTKDGSVIMHKYWERSKACPVAISYGPEPLLFLSGCSSNGIPAGTPEYEYTGFLAGEPVPVIRGNVTGLPIPARSEIAIEGDIPPPDEESRDEGPFGEWTGYYWGIATKEPVVRVKALYFRDDPILYGAPPLKHPHGYASGIRLAGLRGGLLAQFQRFELPVTAVGSLGPLGTTVVSVRQEQSDDVARIMEALDTMGSNNRLIFLVDDDVDASDPYEVLWAVGTRFDPTEARVSTIASAWNLDPTMTLEERTSDRPIPYKRLIINGCRPFHRLKDFPPVNVFSADRRRQAWEKWQMAEWLR